MRRRRFLDLSRRAALAAAAALAAGPATALRIEEEGDAGPRAAAILGRCELRDAHEELVAELIAELEGRESREEAIAEVRAMRCPVCGCSLAEAVPGDAPPRF
jgi:hypothetical protein